MPAPKTQSPFKRDYLQRRRVERDPVELLTSITRGSESGISARLVDLSPLGCHIRSTMQFERGQRIRVILPIAGDVRAEVMWALRGCFGCRFEDEIDAVTYPRILAAIKTGLKDWPIR
jgi:hypothetical protein